MQLDAVHVQRTGDAQVVRLGFRLRLTAEDKRRKLAELSRRRGKSQPTGDFDETVRLRFRIDHFETERNDTR